MADPSLAPTLLPAAGVLVGIGVKALFDTATESRRWRREDRLRDRDAKLSAYGDFLVLVKDLGARLDGMAEIKADQTRLRAAQESGVLHTPEVAGSRREVPRARSLRRPRSPRRGPGHHLRA
jgi:hypothetical protein